MITSVEVENFRGIERLSVSGLGRVNLIIGKNNAGKTALMEAVGLAYFAEDAGTLLAFLQLLRIPNADLSDFEGVWRPIFRSGDTGRGLLVRATRDGIGTVQLAMRKRGSDRLVMPSFSNFGPGQSLVWRLEYDVEASGQKKYFQVSRLPGSEGVAFPPLTYSGGVPWISTGPTNLSNAIRLLSLLKQESHDELVQSLLYQIDKRIAGLEILSPTGAQAAVFVRVANEPMLLPFQAMGDGIQRCFEIAVSIAGSESVFLPIDEIENGLHHSVLELVWKWLAEVSSNRRVQVFATTHSEECVQAACRAFSSLNDDGLRVIRLDRQEHQTVATVYDRNLVEAAERMGVEIRG